MKKIRTKSIINFILVVLCFVSIFHLLVLFQVIPYQIVWGGRLQSLEQMRVFEVISIFVNGLLLIVVAIKGNYLKPIISMRAVDVILKFFIVLFAINTVGNLFAKMSLETIIFTPVTFILAITCYVIVKNDGMDNR